MITRAQRDVRKSQRLVETVVDPVTTCVTITGVHGSGKTEMALQACAYMRERHQFDAFFFADCSAAVMNAASAQPPFLGDTGALVQDPCRVVRRVVWVSREREGARGGGGGGGGRVNQEEVRVYILVTTKQQSSGFQTSTGGSRRIKFISTNTESSSRIYFLFLLLWCVLGSTGR